MSENKTPKNKYPMSGKIEYDYNYHPKTTIVINYCAFCMMIVDSL